MTEKYKLTEHHLDNYGNIEKLKADGFNREQISKAFYKVTEGASTAERTRIYERLYSRQGWERK